MKKSSNIVGLIIFMIAFAFNPIIGLIVGAWLLVKYTKQRSQGTEAGAASNSSVHSKEWIQPEDVKPKKKQQVWILPLRYIRITAMMLTKRLIIMGFPKRIVTTPILRESCMRI